MRTRSSRLIALSLLLGVGCGSDLRKGELVGDASADAHAGGIVSGSEGGVHADASAVGVVSKALAALALPVSARAPADPSNRYADDANAAKFGQVLFFEPSFAGRLLEGDNDGSSHALGVRGQTGRVACAGCHIPQSGFVDTRSLREQISLASGWGKRRTPSLLDVAQSKVLMWDGRHDALYNQIFGVIESPLEMNSSRLFVAKQIFALHRQAYEAIFGPMPPLDDTSRFPALTADRTGCSAIDENTRVCTGEVHGMPGDHAEFDGMAQADQDAVTRVVVNVGKALGAYERLLTCGESRFDKWARGEDPAALTDQEQRGAVLFVGKGKCVECHSGPFFSDEKFHNVGLRPSVVGTVFIDSDDPGASVGLKTAQDDPLRVGGSFSDGDDHRLSAAGSASDAKMLGAFRTPKLRCLSTRPSFMHTGQIGTIDQVVAFFNRGGDGVGFLGTSELKALNLTMDERADLVAFLKALDGPGPDAALLAP